MFMTPVNFEKRSHCLFNSSLFGASENTLTVVMSYDIKDWKSE